MKPRIPNFISLSLSLPRHLLLNVLLVEDPGRMSSLARKLLIFAAVDGLILEQRGRPATKIAYKDHAIVQVPKEKGHGEGTGKSFEAFGVVGTCMRVFCKGQ